MMKSSPPYSPQRPSPSARGQSIVLIAAAFVGVVAFVGLAIDTGLLFIGYGHLRRAVDSAAIAAATQFREGQDVSDITKTAEEFLRLNGVDNVTAVVDICDNSETNATNPDVCTVPLRKLVKVTATSHVDFAFLQVVGLYGTDVTAEAIGEAASMDVVLVLDISESMTWDAACGDGDDDDGDGVIDDGPMNPDPGNPWRVCSNPTAGADGKPDFEARNPILCNAADPGGVDGTPGECHPFEEVKAAAADFAEWVLDKDVIEEADRLAIVVFSNGWEGAVDPTTGYVYGSGNRGTYVVGNNWYKDQGAAVAAIENLQVYQADPCPSDWATSTNPGTCNLSDHPDDHFYGGAVCPFYNPANPVAMAAGLLNGDASTCATTAIGLGLKYGGAMFALDPNPSALWVTILLTDGQANATELDISDTDTTDIPWGYCPAATAGDYPHCQDRNIYSYHSPELSPGVGNPDYDADDYARDAARFIACDPISPAAGCNGIKGQGAIIFSIGLGQWVLNPTADLSGDGEWDQYGDALLRFAARIGDDGNPATNPEPCAYGTTPHKALTGGTDDYQCGNYYFREFGGGLNSVFDDIASRIFTRLSH